MIKIPGRRPKRLANPDRVDALPPPSWKPNCASSHPDAGARHKVAPLFFPGPARAAMSALESVIDSEDGARVQHRRADRYLYATWTSKTFGFVDDVELLLSPEQDGTRIDVRSASRVGVGDQGVNKKRVERLRRKLASRGE